MKKISQSSSQKSQKPADIERILIAAIRVWKNNKQLEMLKAIQCDKNSEG